jgi:hypothetical protein
MAYMTIGELKDILPLLRASGVSSFKDGALEILFRVEQSVVGPEADIIKTKDHTINIPESQLPVDLRTDSITDYDKILNWSGTPDPEASEHPGTNDLQLTLAGQ